MARLSRRDFLKLAAMAPAALAFSQTITAESIGSKFAKYHCACFRRHVGGQFILVWISAKDYAQF